MRDAHARSCQQVPPVTAPRPEDMIRRMANRFNEAREMQCAAGPALPETASGLTFPDTIPEDKEGDGE
jgi:hypothetical protein